MGIDIRSYTFNKEIPEYLYRETISTTIRSLGIADTPMCWSDSVDRRGYGVVGCASATRVLRVVITRHLQPAHTTLRPPPPPPPPTCPTALDGIGGGGGGGGGLVGRGWRVRDEAKGCRGMGGHSIDFVQDSRRRRRRRRGQPDPPLVVPTRLQHRPPPHIPPRLVSYSFSFEHRHSAPRPSRLLAFSLPFSLSLPLSFLTIPFPLCLSSNLRYPLTVHVRSGR